MNAQGLSPDVFEAVVMAFADTLVRHYRERVGTSISVRSHPPIAPAIPIVVSSSESPWLKVMEAAKRARCSRSTIYAEVQSGRLRATQSGRLLRIRTEWLDEWLQGGAIAEPPKGKRR
jgi:excisionase family DNA binding protein